MPWIPSCAIADRVAIFSNDDAIDGKVEDVEVPQTAARSPLGMRVVQPIIWDEVYVTFGDAAMGAQRTAAESRQIVRGGNRSDAGSAIVYDHNLAFAVDRQIEHAGGGCPVIDGFGARNLTGEPHHGLRCSAAVAIDAHKAAERPMMRHEIVGDRAGHRCCAPSELEIERVVKPNELERAVGVGLVAHAMVGNEADDRTELV